MSKHTVRDSVHGAVWQLVQQIHDGDVDDSTVYAVRDSELVPAITRHEVQTLSGASPRVITDTLATLVDMRVLERQAPPERWAFDRHGTKRHGGSIRVWFVPHVLPSDPDTRDMWPDMDSTYSKYYRGGSDTPLDTDSIDTGAIMRQALTALDR